MTWAKQKSLITSKIVIRLDQVDFVFHISSPVFSQRIEFQCSEQRSQVCYENIKFPFLTPWNWFKRTYLLSYNSEKLKIPTPFGDVLLSWQVSFPHEQFLILRKPQECGQLIPTWKKKSTLINGVINKQRHIIIMFFLNRNWKKIKYIN